MTAKVIAIINQKGGCGKTTVTMNLAGTIALRRNKKILVIDGDKQGTATKWAKAASENDEFPCAVTSLASTGKDAHRSIKKFIEDYDYIFVDCPPNIESELNGSVLLVSTMAIIPIPPSTPDLWAMEGTFDLINSVSAINEYIRPRILLNKCEPHKNINKSIAEYIKKNDSIQLLNTSLRSRAIYGEVPLLGKTVYESKNTSASNEMALLADEILEILESNNY